MKALTNHSSERDLLMTYSRCGLFWKPKSIKILLTSRTLSKQTLNLHTKCHQNILTLKFLKDHDSFKVKYLMFKHILSQQKHSNTRISPHATLSVLRRALLKEKLYAYFERTRLRNHCVTEERILNSRYRKRLPSGTCPSNPSRSSFQNGFTKQGPRSQVKSGRADN